MALRSRTFSFYALGGGRTPAVSKRGTRPRSAVEAGKTPTTAKKAARGRASKSAPQPALKTGGQARAASRLRPKPSENTAAPISAAIEPAAEARAEDTGENRSRSLNSTASWQPSGPSIFDLSAMSGSTCWLFLMQARHKMAVQLQSWPTIRWSSVQTAHHVLLQKGAMHWCSSSKCIHDIHITVQLKL